MGRELYQTQPLFRQILEQCDQILRSELEKPLLEILYPQNTNQSPTSLIDQTNYTQPALFALEYALAQLWISWGIKPAVVMGHSHRQQLKTLNVRNFGNDANINPH
jgi:acyl transferase domain-containing protein